MISSIKARILDMSEESKMQCHGAEICWVINVQDNTWLFRHMAIGSRVEVRGCRCILKKHQIERRPKDSYILRRVRKRNFEKVCQIRQVRRSVDRQNVNRKFIIVGLYMGVLHWPTTSTKCVHPTPYFPIYRPQIEPKTSQSLSFLHLFQCLRFPWLLHVVSFSSILALFPDIW